MEAPADGELLIPVRMGRRGSGVAIDLPTATVSKRHHLIVPGKGVGYTFEVGGKPVLFKVPRDFDLARGMPMNGVQGESILGKAWFPNEPSFWDAIQKKIVDGQIARRGRMTLPDGRSERGCDGSLGCGLRKAIRCSHSISIRETSCS